MRSLIISDFPRVILGSVLVLCQPGLTLKEVYPGVFFLAWRFSWLIMAGLCLPVFVRTYQLLQGAWWGAVWAL